MKRASYRDAVDFIAFNDSPNDGDSEEDIANYVTTTLVAEIFGVTREKVARDVAKLRNKGIT